jgi:hypothetical protein
MRKQSVSRRPAGNRQVEPGRKHLSVFVFKFDFSEFHMRSFF